MRTNYVVWALPYACTHPYHPSSGSHGQLFCPYGGSSAWHTHQVYEQANPRITDPLLPRVVRAKHSFKCQLHHRQVVAVGRQLQNSSPPLALTKNLHPQQGLLDSLPEQSKEPFIFHQLWRGGGGRKKLGFGF